jgi:hypothetical protein
MRSPFVHAALTLTLCLGAACGQANLTPNTSGTWKTDCLSQTNNGQTTYSDFLLSDATGVTRFTISFYADSSCASKLMSVGTESNPVLGEPVPTAPGAYAWTINYRKHFAVAFDPTGQGILASVGCPGNFPLGVEQDTSQVDCFFKSIPSCGKDYDIVKVSGNELFNGVRGGDQCVASGQPTALNSFSFHRQP